MRRFTDLYLKPPPNGEVQLQMARLAGQLGYSTVAVDFPPEASVAEIDKVRANFTGVGLDVATRVSITPRSRRQLLESLRLLRGRFEVVAVNCVAAEAVNVAARDGRVDIISFRPHHPHVGFRQSTANICNAALEIVLSWIVGAPASLRGRVIGGVARHISVARSSRVPVLVSSGAENPFMLRAPRDMAAVAASVLGVDVDEALDFTSTVPNSIVDRNRARMKPQYIGNGVRVVGG